MAFETTASHYLVTELLSGRELFEVLSEHGTLPEASAVRVMRGVLSAVAYLHSLDVVHRDIKAENVMFMSKTTAGFMGDVKLIDFGLATVLRPSASSTWKLGTCGYIAPESRRGLPCGAAVDAWACGVLGYLLCCGRLPLSAEATPLPRDPVACAAALGFPLPFAEPQWDNDNSGSVLAPRSPAAIRSPHAKPLLRSLLAVEPEARATAQQALRSPWFVGDHPPRTPERMLPKLPRLQRESPTSVAAYSDELSYEQAELLEVFFSEC